ncbi:MAG: circadian clock protein KaiC [candidate division Zixibacteria bacterium]|nr:circadian clock protein KaiC [candidate division Zixibacteria bacterium]
MINDNSKSREFTKISTGIQGFDNICEGGLPEIRTTLVSGTTGSGKTIFAAQFLAHCIENENSGAVFVTFEESPEDIRRNLINLGWDIRNWEENGKWTFVDASPETGEEVIIGDNYDLGALLVRIEHAIRKVNASRVAIDSISAILARFDSETIVRRDLLRIVTSLKKLMVTSVITVERTEEYGSIARFGVEEFVADNVIILRNVLESEKRRRTIEILKFRGAPHKKGEYPFTINPGEGIITIPISSLELKQKSSDIRIHTGNEKLNKMCGGGFFRNSIILVSGATGTGKTLTATEFLAGGAFNGEKAMLFAFEESREQFFRNAVGWGVDLGKLEAQNKLKVICLYPETAGLEDHLIYMKKEIEKFKPNRIAIDSMSALQRVSTLKGFREFVMGLTSFIKHEEIAGMFTSTTPTLMGGPSVTEAHISSITDTIILLRYVEVYGEMRRGLTVLKMRGSIHDKEIREFTIDGQGMHLTRPFRNITGILSGHAMHVAPEEINRLSNLFPESQGRVFDDGI